MGTAVFTLCMRTGKKHTNPQWTPTLIECDSLCTLSIAPGSWQLIGIYSSLNHWWTPQRCWVVISRWSAAGLAMLRWHGTLIELTLKMRARMRGKLDAPIQNDTMCLSLCVCLFLQESVCLSVCFSIDSYVCVSIDFISMVCEQKMSVINIVVHYDWHQKLSYLCAVASVIINQCL